jgi:hypothetical protein
MADTVRPDDVADPAGSAPVDAPAQPAAPPGDELESSLEEYQSAVSRPAAQPTDQPTGAAPQASGDDIDALLAEWAQGPGQSPLFQHGADAHQQAQAQQLAEHKFNEYVQRAEYMRQETEAAHQIVAEDHRRLQEEFPDVRSVDLDRFYNERLQQNPNFGVAYFNRHRNPQAFRVMHQRLLSEFRQEWKSRPDLTATADHDAVVAAVRGASAKVAAEPPPNFGNMSDSELRKYTREHFGF